MGCLIELFFDVFVEGFVELISYCYMKAVMRLCPKKRISDRTRHIIECVTGLVALLLWLVLITGFALAIQDDPMLKRIGINTAYISLGLILLPVVLSIPMCIIRCIKKKKNAG